MTKDQQSIGHSYKEYNLRFKPHWRIEWIIEELFTGLKEVVGSRLTPMNDIAEEIENARIEADEQAFFQSFR